MALPLFSPGQDPGPDFCALLRLSGSSVTGATGASHRARVLGELSGSAHRMTYPSQGSQVPQVPHGTTVAALRYRDGVVMAGDRRATEGHLIAHRSMEKVFPADRYSAVAIAGAAGPAIEMVKLFQTQLEHYEKVEGVALSLEGKANQLGQMVREHLPMAFQGLVVIPLYAGYDLRREQGRIFTYDVTGGHYEETEHAATGSGGRDARTTIKLGWRPDMERDEAVELAVQALFNAADEDSATGGPDVVRGIYPVVATITARGYERLEEAEVAERFGVLVRRGGVDATPPQPTNASASGTKRRGGGSR